MSILFVKYLSPILIILLIGSFLSYATYDLLSFESYKESFIRKNIEIFSQKSSPEKLCRIYNVLKKNDRNELVKEINSVTDIDEKIVSLAMWSLYSRRNNILEKKDLFFSSLANLKSLQRKKAICQDAVFYAILYGDYDYALKILDVSRQTYFWYVLFAYVYITKPHNVFIPTVRETKSYVKFLENQKPMELSMYKEFKNVVVYSLEFNYYIFGVPDSVVNALLDFKKSYYTKNIDFLKSKDLIADKKQTHQTKYETKVVVLFLYLLNQKQQALLYLEKINNPSTKIETIVELAWLALVIGNSTDAKEFLDLVSPLEKFKLYLLL